MNIEAFFGSFHVAPPENAWERMYQQCIIPVLSYIPPLLASYGIAVFLLTKFTDWRGLKLQKLAGQLSMYPAFFVLVYTSHATMFDTRFWQLDGYATRVEQADKACDVFANFYIAVNIVQAIGQLQTEKPPLLYQLMGHHVLSIACYGSGFYFDKFRWWTAFAGLCEITNIFLVPVFACKEYFPEWKTQIWYLWNSRLLWWTFLVYRLVLFPCWLALWFYDRYQAALDTEAHPVHWVEGVLYPLTIFGLLLLSVVWFQMIDRGLKKQKIAYLEARKAKKKL